MKKICVVTGTRAEYGLLKPLIKKISNDKELQLQLIVTGMHLSSEFGLTFKEIETDGFTITEKVEILLSSDTPTSISKSMGLAMISFSECFERIAPDLVVVLGDRYEIFAVAGAASVARIPIAHLHGGETTEGAFDEAFRHAISKMSYLHFTSTEPYRKRVVQLGENPERVFNVGAIGIENIKEIDYLSKGELEKSLDFNLGNQFALVTFHPVTLEDSTSSDQFENLLSALNAFPNLRVLFTKANSDTNGRVINNMIDSYVSQNPDRAIAFYSLGLKRYLSAMNYTDLVIGNSSSGILEAPAFFKPTVNIGDRQKGRIKADSVIDCKPVTEDIIRAINIALDNEFRDKIKMQDNPYGDGEVSTKIITEIKKFLSSPINLKKSFFDL